MLADVGHDLGGGHFHDVLEGGLLVGTFRGDAEPGALDHADGFAALRGDDGHPDLVLHSLADRRVEPGALDHHGNLLGLEALHGHVGGVGGVGGSGDVLLADQVEGLLDVGDEARVGDVQLAVLDGHVAVGEGERQVGVADVGGDGEALHTIFGQRLGVGEELLVGVVSAWFFQPGLGEHGLVVEQHHRFGVVGDGADLPVDRHALHHGLVVPGQVEAGLLGEVVERGEELTEFLGAGGLRGDDAGRVSRRHAGLDLGPVVLEAGALDVELEVGIGFLDALDEGVPLGAVGFVGHPGVHLARLRALVLGPS